jgi:hypothetical protein
MNRMPTMVQAGVYSSVAHYLKAVKDAGTDEPGAELRKMKETPVNDFMTKNAKIREDGRLMRDFYLFEIKKPSESKGPWDYYKQLAVIPPRKRHARSPRASAHSSRRAEERLIRRRGPVPAAGPLLRSATPREV